MTSLLMSSLPISISHWLFQCRFSNSRDIVASSPFSSCPDASLGKPKSRRLLLSNIRKSQRLNFCTKTIITINLLIHLSLVSLMSNYSLRKECWWQNKLKLHEEKSWGAILQFKWISIAHCLWTMPRVCPDHVDIWQRSIIQLGAFTSCRIKLCQPWEQNRHCHVLRAIRSHLMPVTCKQTQQQYFLWFWKSIFWTWPNFIFLCFNVLYIVAPGKSQNWTTTDPRVCIKMV